MAGSTAAAPLALWALLTDKDLPCPGRACLVPSLRLVPLEPRHPACIRVHQSARLLPVSDTRPPLGQNRVHGPTYSEGARPWIWQL